MACPNPADHARVSSLVLQVAALKAELRACERREADLAAKLATVTPPEPVSQYTLLRDAYKNGPVSAKDEEMRLVRGFSDVDLGICLRVLHCIVMRPKLVPEFSQKLHVAKGLFVRPEPMPTIRSKAASKIRPMSVRALKELDRVKKFKFCKMQRDYTRDLMKLRAALPALVKEGKVSLNDVTIRYLERTDMLMQKVATSTDDSPFLRRKEACWSCKAPYNVLHPVYEKLCYKCAQLNVEKRLAYADLTGRVAVVTGGRVRIGFHVTVSLLRMGATVVVTTRFPVDCILQLSKLPDFNTWKDRLVVYGLDMRSPSAVECFTSDLAARFPHIHILINNAAQTIAKPPGFYAHLLEVEALGHDALPPALRPLMMHDNRTLVQLSPTAPVINVTATGAALASSGPGTALSTLPTGEETEPIEVQRVTTSSTSLATTEVLHPLGVTIPVSAMAKSEDIASVPIRWAEGDQLDMRASNSWNHNMLMVSTEELVEVQAVNVVAPFIIIRNLEPLMAQTPGNKYVVNVSAMEGQFYRWKPSTHPHTNMAKAALNMLTRTLGTSLAVSGINLTCVDTGWVTDEMSLPRQALRGTPFVPPLGPEDGAARVLDPIIMGEKGEKLQEGNFYKDFKPTYW